MLRQTQVAVPPEEAAAHGSPRAAVTPPPRPPEACLAAPEEVKFIGQVPGRVLLLSGDVTGGRFCPVKPGYFLWKGRPHVAFVPKDPDTRSQPPAAAPSVPNPGARTSTCASGGLAARAECHSHPRQVVGRATSAPRDRAARSRSSAPSVSTACVLLRSLAAVRSCSARRPGGAGPTGTGRTTGATCWASVSLPAPCMARTCP